MTDYYKRRADIFGTMPKLFHKSGPVIENNDFGRAVSINGSEEIGYLTYVMALKDDTACKECGVIICGCQLIVEVGEAIEDYPAAHGWEHVANSNQYGAPKEYWKKGDAHIWLEKGQWFWATDMGCSGVKADSLRGAVDVADRNLSGNETEEDYARRFGWKLHATYPNWWSRDGVEVWLGASKQWWWAADSQKLHHSYKVDSLRQGIIAAGEYLFQKAIQSPIYTGDQCTCGHNRSSHMLNGGSQCVDCGHSKGDDRVCLEFVLHKSWNSTTTMKEMTRDG